LRALAGASGVVVTQQNNPWVFRVRLDDATGAVLLVKYRPVRNASQLSAIVATLSLGMVLENSVVLIWGPQSLGFSGPLGNATGAMFGARIYAQYPLILVVLLAR
jgi:branched-subunit amino acid ABC-type transport system permease component